MLPSLRFASLFVAAVGLWSCVSPHATSRSSSVAPARAAKRVALSPDNAVEQPPEETAEPVDRSPDSPAPLSPAAERAKTVVEGEIERALQTPSVKRLFTRALEGVTDPATAHRVGYVLGERLARRGAGRLTGSDLEEWADMRFRLAQTGPDVCAGLWTGKQAQDWLYRALGTLPEGDALRFGRLSGKVITAEANSADKPLPVFPVDTFQDGLLLLLQGAPQETRDRVVSALDHGAQAEQADACAITRLVFGTWRKLPVARRGPFLHALAVATVGE